MRNALLLIDMQNDIAHPDGRWFVRDAAGRVSAMAAVAGAFREGRQPVIHVVRSHRADGWDVERFRVPGYEQGGGALLEDSWGRRIVERLEPVEGEPIVVKRRFSGFMGTELDLLLRRARIERLYLCGVSLPNSPRATAVDAIALDYDVVAVEDGLATANEDTRQANLADLQAIGVRVATAEDVMREIERAAERATT